MIHGEGVYKWPDGRVYSGEYVKDKKHGFGKFVMSDGSKYEGEWLDGKQHGRGKIITKNNKIREGNWDNGKFISFVNKGGSPSKASRSRASFVNEE